jgi:hypothetical protein
MKEGQAMGWWMQQANLMGSQLKKEKIFIDFEGISDRPRKEWRFKSYVEPLP